MKYTNIFIILILLLISSSACGKIRAIEVNYNVQVPNENMTNTLNNFFQNFNYIRNWKEYSTETFIKRVYSWCTGDYSEEATIDEMVQKYNDVNKNSLRLISIDINKIIETENNEMLIEVLRKWENGQTDETTYVLLLENEVWKVDNRL